MLHKGSQKGCKREHTCGLLCVHARVRMHARVPKMGANRDVHARAHMRVPKRVANRDAKGMQQGRKGMQKECKRSVYMILSSGQCILYNPRDSIMSEASAA